MATGALPHLRYTDVSGSNGRKSLTDLRRRATVELYVTDCGGLVVCGGLVEPREGFNELLSTPDWRGESVRVAFSATSNMAVGLQTQEF